ncbi:MAG: hypothetical protein EGS50_03440 [Alistipes senegalensis]|nr:hypothetical protein [Alistipes senegalensis]
MLLQRVKISKNAENGFVEKRFKIFFLYLTGQNQVLDRLRLGKTANEVCICPRLVLSLASP